MKVELMVAWMVALLDNLMAVRMAALRVEMMVARTV